MITFSPAQVSNTRDAIALNGQVGVEPWPAAAVDDASMTND